MEAESSSSKPFASWAVLELMGRTVVAGFAEEISFGGTTMIRLDVPAVTDPDSGDLIPAWSKIYSPTAIWACTPVGEDEAKMAAAKCRARPLPSYVLPAAKPLTPRLLAQMGEWDEQSASDADVREDDRHDDDDDGF